MGSHKITQILFALPEPCYELREDDLMTVDWLKNKCRLVGRLSSFLSNANLNNEWSYTTTQPYSYLYLYLNLKATKETKILRLRRKYVTVMKRGNIEWRLHMQQDSRIKVEG